MSPKTKSKLKSKQKTPEVAASSVTPLAYSVEDAARALGGVSTKTVYNLFKAGQLVRRKIGSRSVVPLSSIEAFLRRDHATK